ncbi:MAG TPA: hypothetical protein VK900_19185 [Anaerolineales bacterium]|nr:hypothetical protein [Anaerolineales bacterium]
MKNKPILDASTPWQLWYSDTFDRDSPASLQASGEGILQGLTELWRYTLQEGIHYNGSASFSYFYLTVGNTAWARVDVSVQPFHNPALMKLRQWAHLADRDHAENITTAPSLQAQRLFIFNRLAQLHYALLKKSDRWRAAAIDWSAEARALLARVESVTSLKEL